MYYISTRKMVRIIKFSRTLHVFSALLEAIASSSYINLSMFAKLPAYSSCLRVNVYQIPLSLLMLHVPGWSSVMNLI